MTRKRKEGSQPRKLEEFYPPKGRGLIQDGAGAGLGDASPSSPCSSRSTASSPRMHPGTTQQSPGGSTPFDRSPAKSKPRLEANTSQVSGGAEALEDTRELIDPFTAFPTSGKAVSDTTLKDMLVSLRSSMHADMLQCMRNFKADVGELGDRVTHVEEKMGEFASSHNSLIDAHSEHDTEIAWLRAKVADLEDRSRRNNVKLRGVPETVLPAQLQKFARDLLQQILPDASESELQIDRIHRLPKPGFLPDNVPRDVLLRIHFYQIKEQLMTSFRKAQQLPEQFAGLQLFTDLSQFTMQKRRSLVTITKALRNHNVPYRWGFPVKLTVTHDGKDTTIVSLEEGLTLLRSLDILPAQAPTGPMPSAKIDQRYQWQTVSRKKSGKKRAA